jgi:RNA polymerase sigma factor (sigma-70 family)
LTNLQVLIQGCIANDTRCQKRLYEQFYGYAFKIAFRYIYSYDQVPDIVNDSFIKLFRSLPQFKGSEGLQTEPRLMGWVKKIVVNTAIDELRRTKSVPAISDVAEVVLEIASENEKADNGILYKELISQVKRLPTSSRAVFNMYVIDGFSHQEIADRLGISVGTSKSNLSKARAYLQKLVVNASVV